MFSDLRFVFFLGLWLLGFGVIGISGNVQECGSFAMAGSILVLAAVVGNSINAIREVLEEQKTD